MHYAYFSTDLQQSMLLYIRIFLAVSTDAMPC